MVEKLRSPRHTVPRLISASASFDVKISDLELLQDRCDLLILLLMLAGSQVFADLLGKFPPLSRIS